jgi:uncharacterized protein (DUF2235 family)/ABC-type multidrug transport system ATPase subunit
VSDYLNRKNIVLCSEGTGNTIQKFRGTNVWKLYEAIDLGAHRWHEGGGDASIRSSEQIAFYDDGVGSQQNKILKIIGGVFGYGLNRNIRDLYKSICRAYWPGDDIYIFGFGRGAYTARVLAGFILSCGIVRHDAWKTDRELDDLSKLAYKKFRSHFRLGTTKGRRAIRAALKASEAELRLESAEKDAYEPLSQEVKARREVARQANKEAEAASWKAKANTDEFRREYSIRDDTYAPDGQISIKFIGVWDTIVAIGLPFRALSKFWNRFIYTLMFPDYKLSSRVEKCFHAVSIDDKRRSFHPIMWDEREQEASRNPQVEQVWFAGVHSNVGGGYPKQGLSMVALDWMMQKAEEKGLKFIRSERDRYRRQQNVQDKLYDSRSGLAVFYRYCPRDIAKICRQFGIEPKIHVSTLERIARGTQDYAPGNLPGDFTIVTTDPNSSAGPETLKEVLANFEGVTAMEKVSHWVTFRRYLHKGTIAVTTLIIGFAAWYHTSIAYPSTWAPEGLDTAMRWVASLIPFGLTLYEYLVRPFLIYWIFPVSLIGLLMTAYAVNNLVKLKLQSAFADFWRGTLPEQWWLTDESGEVKGTTEQRRNDEEKADPDTEEDVRQIKEQIRGIERNMEGENPARFAGELLAFVNSKNRGSGRNSVQLQSLKSIVEQQYFASWPDYLQEHFSSTFKKIVNWNDYFLSYTNKNAQLTNKNYKHLIAQGIQPERNNSKIQNQMSLMINDILRNENLLGIYDEVESSKEEPLVQQVRQNLLESFTMIQIIGKDSFIDDLNVNRMQEEFEHFIKVHPETGSEPTPRLQFIVLSEDSIQDLLPASIPSKYVAWVDYMNSHRNMMISPSDSYRQMERKIREVARRIAQTKVRIIDSLIFPEFLEELETNQANQLLENRKEEAKNKFKNNLVKKTVLREFSLQGVSIFDDFTYSFNPRLNVLLGKNGYGKSHLFRMLALLLLRDQEKAEGYFRMKDFRSLANLRLEQSGSKMDLEVDFNASGFPDGIGIGQIPMLAIPDVRFVDQSKDDFGKAEGKTTDLKKDGASIFISQEPMRGLIENFFHELGLRYFKDHQSFESPIFDLVKSVVRELTDTEFKFDGVKMNETRLTINVITEGNLEEAHPLQKSSQGTLSVLIIFGLIYRYLESVYKEQSIAPEELIKQHAIVLIDEVDAHLHPHWQQKIIRLLRDTFPNIQFFITAHSPIVVAGCWESEVAVLRSGEKGFYVEGVEQDFIASTAGEIYEYIFEVEDGRNEAYVRYASYYPFRKEIQKELKELQTLKSQAVETGTEISQQQEERLGELYTLVRSFQEVAKKQQLAKEDADLKGENRMLRQQLDRLQAQLGKPENEERHS